MLRLCIIALWLLGYQLMAQESERSTDLGLALGTAYYTGDVGKGFLSPHAPSISANLRFNPSLRLSWLTQLSYQSLRGDSRDLVGTLPRSSHFEAKVLNLMLGGEYHWYRYGSTREYLRAKAWTPFVGGGLGLSYAWDEQSILCPSLYISLGLKLRLSERLQAVGAWAWHYALSDKLDALSSSSQLHSPIGQTSNLIRHGDSFGQISIGLSWRLGQEQQNCN